MKIPFFRQWPLSTHQVLEALSDGEFHSGLDLARELSISRTAIWKIIKKLETYQIFIETHRRQGYKLNPMSSAYNFYNLLSEEKITEYLSAETRDELEIFVYYYSPLKHWAQRFFEHRRPLTDLSLCLLETQGTPPSAFGRNIHAALGLSFSKIFTDSSQFYELAQGIGLSITKAFHQELSLKVELIQPDPSHPLRFQFCSDVQRILKTMSNIKNIENIGNMDLQLQPNTHGHFLIITQLNITVDFSDRNRFIAVFLDNLHQNINTIFTTKKTASGSAAFSEDLRYTRENFDALRIER